MSRRRHNKGNRAPVLSKDVDLQGKPANTADLQAVPEIPQHFLFSGRIPEVLLNHPSYFGFIPLDQLPRELEKGGSNFGKFITRCVDHMGKFLIIVTAYGDHCEVHYRVGVYQSTKHKRRKVYALEYHPRGFKTLGLLLRYYGNESLEPKLLECQFDMKCPMDRKSVAVPLRSLRIIAPIGEGNFCQVQKVEQICPQGGNRLLAMKSCHKVEGEVDPQKGKNIVVDMLHEAKMLSGFKDYTFITMFYGVCYDEPIPKLIMELCPYGSIESYIIDKSVTICVAERVLFLSDIARGMAHLEDNHCVHRDLASRNCLISAKGIVKIADFGLTRQARELQSEKERFNEFKAPVRWMAPECLNRHPAFSNKSDAWAYGMTIYEIFSDGLRPYDEDTEMKIVAKKIRSGITPELPRHCLSESKTPGGVVELMKLCWEKNPRNRPPFRFMLKRIYAIAKRYGSISPYDRCFKPNEEQAALVMHREKINFKLQEPETVNTWFYPHEKDDEDEKKNHVNEKESPLRFKLPITPTVPTPTTLPKPTVVSKPTTVPKPTAVPKPTTVVETRHAIKEVDKHPEVLSPNQCEASSSNAEFSSPMSERNARPIRVKTSAELTDRNGPMISLHQMSSDSSQKSHKEKKVVPAPSDPFDSGSQRTSRAKRRGTFLVPSGVDNSDKSDKSDKSKGREKRKHHNKRPTQSQDKHTIPSPEPPATPQDHHKMRQHDDPLPIPAHDKRATFSQDKRPSHSRDKAIAALESSAGVAATMNTTTNTNTTTNASTTVATPPNEGKTDTGSSTTTKNTTTTTTTTTTTQHSSRRSRAVRSSSSKSNKKSDPRHGKSPPRQSQSSGTSKDSTSNSSAKRHRKPSGTGFLNTIFGRKPTHSGRPPHRNVSTAIGHDSRIPGTSSAPFSPSRDDSRDKPERKTRSSDKEHEYDLLSQESVLPEPKKLEKKKPIIMHKQRRSKSSNRRN